MHQESPHSALTARAVAASISVAVGPGVSVDNPRVLGNAYAAITRYRLGIRAATRVS